MSVLAAVSMLWACGAVTGTKETGSTEPAAETVSAETGAAAETSEASAAVTELPLAFAEQFRMERLPGGCTLLTVADEEHFLVVPEGTAKENADKDLETARRLVSDGEIPVLQLPLRNLYVADSSVMDLFRELDALDAVRFTSTREEDWRIPEIAAAVEEERILFAGKYNAPDYELLLEEGTSLAIENTMIFHSPETKEQLERLGIPVLVGC